MRALIERICSQEGVEVDDAVYPLVIRAGGGSPRDTLSVLDQLLAGAEGNRITYPRALALLGVTDVALIDDAVDALAAGDAAALFGAVESVVDAGHDPRRFATDLLERFRDLIVLQSVPDAAARGVVDAPGDVLERMRDQAARIGTATLTRYAEVVHAGLGEMRGATAPRLLLEVVCARLLLPSASDSESALLQRVERIETRLDMSVPEAKPPAKTTASPHRSRRPSEAGARPASRASTGAGTRASRSLSRPTAIGEPDAAAVRRQWSDCAGQGPRAQPHSRRHADRRVVSAVDGDTLVLTHRSVTLAKRLSEQRNADVIREALKDALGVDWKVRCELAAPSPDPKPAERADEDSMLAEANASRPPTRRVATPRKQRSNYCRTS